MKKQLNLTNLIIISIINLLVNTHERINAMKLSQDNKQINNNSQEQLLITIPLIPFYFVRHGQTDWNVEGRFQGKTDIPLNETGRQQARNAAQMLALIDLASICHSPLSRAKETALIIANSHTASLHEIDDLQERFCGSGEGKIKPADFNLEQSYPPEFFIGTERDDDFTLRIIRSINQALTLPGPVCIVSHGGVFRSLCRHLNINSGSINNAAIVHFVPQEKTWSMTEINQYDKFPL